jgi:hypothetical protein
MLHFDTDDLRDVFVYAIIDDYLKTCNHCRSTRASAIGQPPKLTDVEPGRRSGIVCVYNSLSGPRRQLPASVSIFMATRCIHDQIGFELLNFDLPIASAVYAYNHYAQEALPAQATDITFQPIRRSNSHHPGNASRLATTSKRILAS